MYRVASSPRSSLKVSSESLAAWGTQLRGQPFGVGGEGFLDEVSHKYVTAGKGRTWPMSALDTN